MEDSYWHFADDRGTPEGGVYQTDSLASGNVMYTSWLSQSDLEAMLNSPEEEEYGDAGNRIPFSNAGQHYDPQYKEGIKTEVNEFSSSLQDDLHDFDTSSYMTAAKDDNGDVLCASDIAFMVTPPSVQSQPSSSTGLLPSTGISLLAQKHSVLLQQLQPDPESDQESKEALAKLLMEKVR